MHSALPPHLDATTDHFHMCWNIRKHLFGSPIWISLQQCMKQMNVKILWSSLHPFVTPPLTLVGLGVSSDQVLEFKAVGSHLLLRLAANSRHVAVLHLCGAAAGPGVDTHSERLTYKTEAAEKIFRPRHIHWRSTDIFSQDSRRKGLFHEVCTALLWPWIKSLSHTRQVSHDLKREWRTVSDKPSIFF